MIFGTSQCELSSLQVLRDKVFTVSAVVGRVLIIASALLPGLLCLASFETARAQSAPSSIEEGRVLHQSSGRLYHFRINADSTIQIRQESPSPSDSSLVLPVKTFTWIYNRVDEQLLSSGWKGEYVFFSYQDQALVLRFTKRFNLYVLISLVVVVIVGGGLSLWLWRRLARERRRREALAQSQRYLTKGREKERARLAQEIHDGPVQDLHGLHMKINALPEPPDLDRISEELMRVTGELRAMSADLHPPALQRFGLPAALRSHADRLADRHDVHFDMNLPEDCGSMPDEYALSFFRIAQESMNNAVQHGQARRVWVNLTCADDQLTLTVEDDGTGFTLPDDWHALAEEEHYGLLGMRERADAINAELDIESDPDAGTRIRLHGSIEEFNAVHTLSADDISVPA